MYHARAGGRSSARAAATSVLHRAMELCGRGRQNVVAEVCEPGFIFTMGAGTKARRGMRSGRQKGVAHRVVNQWDLTPCEMGQRASFSLPQVKLSFY